VGGALYLDGSYDYVDATDFDLAEQFSICLWVSPSSTADPQCFIGKHTSGGDNILLLGFYEGGYHLRLRSDWFVAGTKTEGWQHLVVVGSQPDGGHTAVTLYKDGDVLWSETMNDVVGNMSGKGWTMGQDWDGSKRTDFFRGIMDEVRLYNRALSAEEVQELYELELPELAGLEITGPNEVPEGFAVDYHAIAHYGNNGTSDVTESAVWSVEPEMIASIEGGLLTTEQIGTGQEDITIQAQYSKGDVTLGAVKAVSVYDVCPSGSALYFDGANDYVDSTDFDLAEDYSICLWANPATTADGQCFIGKHTSRGDNIVVLGLYDGGNHVRIRGDWIVVGTKTVGWQHFAISASEIDASRTAVTAYKNGCILYSGIFDSVAGNMGGKGWTIGQDWDSRTRTDFFEGAIDEVALFNRALSGEEIRANMRSRPTGEEAELAACWDFDEGEGQTAYDVSGNGNHGRLGSTPYADNSDPTWVESDAPVGACAVPVAVDIKPGSCPNPLSVNSRGVLPAAILGSEHFDVHSIDPVSIQLAGVSAIRSSLEDVATLLMDADDCECSEAGPDGYADLTLKFNTQEITEALGDVNDADVVRLTLTGVLQDSTLIEGTDCIVVRGKARAFKRGDINKDGVVNIIDFAMMVEDWLESTVVDD
jgi:hypothetical protein